MKYARRAVAIPFIVAGYACAFLVECCWSAAEAVLGDDDFDLFP
ncbi:MAG: hypothetical protein RLZZ127_1511 [Planctomycetota bacterium]|jgi:hypothetical protein